MKKAIHDITTNEVTVVDMSNIELAQVEKDLVDAAKIKQDREIKETKKLEVLAKLGLTLDDLAALGL